MRPLVRSAITVPGAAMGYYACAVIGTLLSVPPSGFAIIWPATAFLIAALLLLPPRQWWLCAAGVVPAHYLLAAILQPSVPLIVVTTQIAGNLLLAAATVLAVRRWVAKPLLFDTFGSVLRYVLVAGLAVPAVVNALILSVHLGTGWIQDFWLAWGQWMIAGIFPTVTLPALAVVTFRGCLTGRPADTPDTRLELAVLAPLLFIPSFLAFGGTLDVAHWPALFLTPFPFLLWAAVRLGVGGTSCSLLVLAAAIVTQALRHNGPFAEGSPIEEVISLQAFLVTSSIPLMLLAALMDERRRTADLLVQSEARMQVAASSTDTGLWQWDARARQMWLTRNCREMFGLGPDTLPTRQTFLDAVHPEDRARMAGTIDDALAGVAQTPVEFRLRPDGPPRWILMHTHTDRDDAGQLIRVSGVFRDISERVAVRLEADQLRRRLVSLQDDERRRIAEELHDSTAQHLTAASLNLANLELKVPAKTRGLVAEILQSVREATTEIRTFAYLLHPPQLDEGGLCSVLRQYVPGFERRTGVRTSLRLTPRAELLPPDQQQAILRIAQESLGNVHRHALAKTASVDVRCIAGNVHLIVRDDGKGIRPDAGQQLGERLRLGVGMPAMTARVRQLGGRIDVSARRTGTTIHVAIPLPRAAAGEPPARLVRAS